MTEEPANKAISGWRFKIYEVIFGYDTFAGKLFDIGLIVVIIMSVIVVMLESVAIYHDSYSSLFEIMEWMFTILFTIEYVARIVSIGKPWKYIFSFYGIIQSIKLFFELKVFRK